MVFSSPLFLFIFFPLCLIFYLIANGSDNIHLKNACLLIFSIIFYAYGSLEFLPILLLSIVINHLLSMAMSKAKQKNIRKTYFIISIVFNIGMLFVYKYLNLFTGFLFGEGNATHITLPIGISFYTFQVVSYLVDVYKKDVKHCKNVFNFALFTMLFPQLIAGPIVRYSTIEKEMRKRKTDFNSFAEGIFRFMVGFTKKIIFANSLGKISDLAFRQLGYYRMGTWLSVFVIVCYSMQIYLDFWAYSDMAIGIGKIFGFHFLENFNMPFISTTITEFWTRWHISLSTFFKDYVYIPLGGNRKGLIRTCINLMIVFALSGFWHGASFNFLFWGIYNGVFLVVERIIKTKFKFKLPQTIGIIYVFIVWNIGMIFFRLETFDQVLTFLNGAFTTPLYNFYARELVNAVFTPPFIVCFVISALYLTPIFDKIRNALYNTRFGFIIVDVVVVALFIFAVAEMLTSGFNPFIYFRF